MGLDDSISAALDTAIGGSATPASSADTASPSSATPAAPSAKTADAPVVPGKGTQPKPSAKATGGPTRQAAPDSAPQDDLNAQIREKQQRELENRSKKERETVFTELASELGFDLRDQNVRANLRAFQQNPNAYVRQNAQRWGLTLAEAQAQAAQVAAAQQPQAEPQPDLVAEDGVTLAYSAPQLAAWHAWQQNQFSTQLDQRLQPMQQITDWIQTQLAWQQANAQAQDAVGEVRDLPHFERFRQEMHDMIKADGRVTPASAYARCLKKYSADLKNEERNGLLNELKSRPSVAVDPAPVGAMPRGNQRAKRSGLDQMITDATEKAFANAR